MTEIVNRFDFALEYLVTRLDALPAVAFYSTLTKLSELLAAGLIGTHEEAGLLLFEALFHHPVCQVQEVTGALTQLTLIPTNIYLRSLQISYTQTTGRHRHNIIIGMFH